MADNGKNTQRIPLRKDVQGKLSVEDIRKAQDSLVENIGALRFAIARIERLENAAREAGRVLGKLPDLAPYNHLMAVLDGQYE